MEIVILLVPLGLFLAGLAVAAFMWGLRRGQFEDLESRGWEVVFDDRAERRESDKATNSDQAEASPDAPTPDDRSAHESPSLPREKSWKSDTGGRQ